MEKYISLIQNKDASIKSLVHSVLNDKNLDVYFQILNSYIYCKEERGLTIKEIAKISEIPEQTIMRFENLKTIPQTTTLIKILDAVGLELSIQKKSGIIEA